MLAPVHRNVAGETADLMAAVVSVDRRVTAESATTMRCVLHKERVQDTWGGAGHVS